MKNLIRAEKWCKILSKINFDLNKAYRLFYPRLTVIVSCGTLSASNALTIAWSTPLSVDPPLIGILITNKRYSYIFGSVKRMFIGMVVYTFTWHHLW